MLEYLKFNAMWGYVLAVVSIIACLLYTRLWKNKILVSRKANQEDLREGYEKILQASPYTVFAFDAAFHLLKLCNPRQSNAFPLNIEDMGKDIRKLVEPGLAEQLEAGAKCILTSGKAFKQEFSLKSEKGIQYFNLRFLEIKKGEIVCLLRNITERKQAEILQQENQELLNVILDNLPFPVMLKDVDDNFRYIYWNKECNRQSGFHRDEILGKTDIDIYGTERGAKYRQIDKQVAQEAKPYRTQELFTTPDGVEHYTIVTKNLIINEFHRWLLVTRRDISHLVQTEKSLREMNRLNHLILNNTNLGFVFINPQFVVEWENVSANSHQAIASRYREGKKCYENIGQQQPCKDCIVQRVFHSRKIESVELQLADGVTAEVVGNPVWNEKKELVGVVLKVEDVTQKKQAAEELRIAKEEAEKSDQLKSSFLANMSHEIRTPLNAILGFSDLLCITENVDERRSYIEVIKSNGDLLLQLINDILDLSKIEVNSLEYIYSDTDVNALLEELTYSCRYKVANRPELEIVFEPGLAECIVYTERNRLLQVLSNLMTNAIKFTDKGKIRMGYTPVKEGLYFYVADTGIGIPQKKLQEIFNRFVKLDNFKVGTGLGLAICQTIVHKMHGEIGVNSELGKGSTFWFIWPCQGNKGLPEEETNTIIGNTVPLFTPENKLVEKMQREKRRTLLIAEDVTDNYRLFRSFLEKEYNLLHAKNGKEAVELFERYQPDAVLMDIKMPEMDGYEATALIRQADCRVPVIAVTAFAFPEDKAKILNSGFSAYLTKPFTSSSLKEVLAQIQWS